MVVLVLRTWKERELGGSVVTRKTPGKLTENTVSPHPLLLFVCMFARTILLNLNCMGNTSEKVARKL